MAFQPNLMNSIRDAAQARIRKGAFADAEASKEEIERVGGEIARKLNGVISAAPIKSSERATQKVQLDYGGDWHSIKDLARMTIIVPTPGDCQRAVAELRNQFTASKGGGIVQIKDVKPAMDPCGYSSTTVFVRTTNGRFAEIQINIPEIIYAKQSAESVTRALGTAWYTRIKARYQLQGGLGHVLYEVYRVAPLSERGRRCAQVSRDYYDYFRLPSGMLDKRQRLLSEFNALGVAAH